MNRTTVMIFYPLKQIRWHCFYWLVRAMPSLLSAHFNNNNNNLLDTHTIVQRDDGSWRARTKAEIEELLDQANQSAQALLVWPFRKNGKGEESLSGSTYHDIFLHQRQREIFALKIQKYIRN